MRGTGRGGGGFFRRGNNFESEIRNQTSDSEFGIKTLREGEEKPGFLINLAPCTCIVNLESEASSSISLATSTHTSTSGNRGGSEERAGIEFYFLEEQGTVFKAQIPYAPYFYAIPSAGHEIEAQESLRLQYGQWLLGLEAVQKEDLALPNHLAGLTRTVLKLSFRTLPDLLHVRGQILPLLRKNRQRHQVGETYQFMDALSRELDRDDHGGLAQEGGRAYASHAGNRSGLDFIEELREYDVPYYQRVAIDTNIRVAQWYNVRSVTPSSKHAGAASSFSAVVSMEKLPQRDIPPELKVLAFDIECTKQELRFPDAEVDVIFMISYMIDSQGYLIINRQVVSQDIDDFEYTPKPEFPGQFVVFNEADEKGLLDRFFSHIREERPHVFVTFNGDNFDWPFVAARAKHHDIDMASLLGLSLVASGDGEYQSRWASNLDVYKWVMRDSYLPQGSQGLKAVTKAKLGYDPIEIDPEEMVELATSDPQRMAAYSVSDAVATYYLYHKYVHPFIYSLCTILPMNADDVLRKGSGTLCEALLMVEAFKVNIIYPNKQDDSAGHKFTQAGHLLETETYIGGHVEALESGVFRKDLKYRFQLNADTFQSLIDQLDSVIEFAIIQDAHKCVSDATNIPVIRQQILERLIHLRDHPSIDETPLLYHLDVAAMYPNIILTNRLQPSAVVSQATCAACDFNSPESNCQRKMQWTWRGDYIPATKQEYELIRSRLESQRFSSVERKSNLAEAEAEMKKRKFNKGKMNANRNRFSRGAPARINEDEFIPFHKLPFSEQQQLIKKRLKEYSKRAYNKTHVISEEERIATVCMRENPFYVGTVRNFRDRRYTYKDLLKQAQGQYNQARHSGDPDSISKASKRIVLYDSLQLAHKCILNSFYGYVMRRGARWFSMEMAGIVTNTGSEIIKRTRELVEKIGRPLELDTDGIWCMLPQSFPENFRIEFSNRSPFVLSYPCQVLNHLTHQHFTNHQYQDRTKTGTFDTRSECSIFFEVDGPYRAMVFPAAKEEGKKLKKRYAVFHDDGTLAELKGFELKRRGELKMIKIFQGQIFANFLGGTTLEECYQEVAKVANHWLDIIDHRGASADESELLDWLSCSANMSRKLSDYGASQKTPALVTARRLAEFLGPQMVQNKGLSCTFIISSSPAGAPTTERAIPVAIFQTDPQIRQHYLRRWCKIRPGSPDAEYSVKNLLDWNYYRSRLASVIQKIITIPAALQNLPNPVPRVDHPDWLQRKLAAAQQTKLHAFWTPINPADSSKHAIADLEDFGNTMRSENAPAVARVVKWMGNKRERAPQKSSSFLIRTGKSVTDILNSHVLAFDEGFLQLAEGAGPITSPEQLHSVRVDPRMVSIVMHRPLPDPRRDSQGWLRWLKCKWNLQRAQRLIVSSQDAVTGDHDGLVINPKRPHLGQSQPAAPLSLADLRKRQRQAILSSTWQILEIAETGIPGELRLWVLIDSSNLVPLIVIVPREFYINTSQTCLDENDSRYKKVDRLLPRSRPVHHLYKVTMSEESYQSGQRELLNIFSHPQVHDVYETQLSLLFHCLLRVGCVCRLTLQARQRYGLQKGGIIDRFHFDDLEIRPHAVSLRYLAEDVSSFSRIYIYYSEASSTRGCLTVFSPASAAPFITDARDELADPDPDGASSSSSSSSSYSSSSSTMHHFVATIYILHNAPDPTERAIMKQFQRELLKTYRDAQGIQDISNVRVRSFKVYRLGPGATTADLFAEVDRHLADLKESNRSPLPMITVVQAPMDRKSFLTKLPRLQDDGPLMFLEGNPSDNQYPTFGWDNFLSQTVLLRFFEFFPIFNAQLRASRYANLPLCNLEADYPLFVSDVLFARLLREANHLLWVSESHRPDVGHAAEDEVLFAEELFPASISKPGCFPTVCIDLELKNLPLNSILLSAEIHNAEGSSDTLLAAGSLSQHSDAPNSNHSSLMNNNHNNNNNNVNFETALDDTHSPWVPMKILKILISQWARDYEEDQTLVGDLISHLYRWLSSPQSRMYDSALHRMVFRAMKKVFVQLLSELHVLGSEIVYAYFNRVIVQTSKDSVGHAQAYWEFVGNTLQEKSIFRYLDLIPRQFWDIYVFLDSGNFGGLIEVDDPSGTATEITSHWNAASYLPEVVENHFLLLVGEFLLQIFQSRKKLTLKKQKSGSTATSFVAGGEGGVPFEWQVNQQKLFVLVESIAQNIDYQESGTHHQMPAADRIQGSPALNFVNLLIKVISLYAPAADQALVIRRSLLRLLKIREFAPEAQFMNPCPTFVLPDVICQFCSNVHDLDLLRDINLLANRWNCTHCEAPINKEMVELRLVDFLQRRTLSYQLQDLRCPKCKLVKEDYLATLCSTCFCAFEPTQPKDHALEYIQTLSLVANFHQFQYLQSILAQF